jgi:hypothetical protein
VDEPQPSVDVRFLGGHGMGVMDPDDSPARLVPVPQARQAFLAEFG